MADDDIDDIDFDENFDVQDDVEQERTPPPPSYSSKARRELEKRLEMKRLRELLDDTDLDVDI